MQHLWLNREGRPAADSGMLFISKIADKVEVYRSTISRELKRNTDGKYYEPAQAHSNAHKRRAQSVG